MDEPDSSIASKLRGALVEVETRKAVNKRLSIGGKLYVDEILQQMTRQLEGGKRVRDD